MPQLASLDALAEFANVKLEAPKLTFDPTDIKVTVEVPGLTELIAQLTKMRSAAHGYTPLAG